MTAFDAVVLHEHGGPEVLVRETLDMAEPGSNQVRVSVRAVAMNHMDLWVRRGGPAFHVEYPHRLGCEVAGVVESVGPDVGDVQVGQRVVVSPGISCGVCRECLAGRDNLCRHYKILGENTQGGYGELLTVPRANIAPCPERLDFAHAAAGLLTFQTAWQMLMEKARLEPGEMVLVHGAGSGVGVAALQICRMMGCPVIATAGSDDKLAKAAELGADHGINYRTSDFVKEVKAITGKRGVDVVFEHIGGETLAKSIRVTRSGGRIVTCGATAGFTAEIDLRHVFFRQIAIIGSTMSSKATLLTVLDHVAAGRLEPVVDREMPLWRAAEAHQLLEDRKIFGKLVLTI